MPRVAATGAYAWKRRECELYKYATQAVMGEGPKSSTIVFVGEQPGDEEDRRGHRAVGPGGHLFDRALADAGIDRATVYVTNAVKHFKFEGRGKRRIHKKPGATEVSACKPWLEAELAAIQPSILVCLGATGGAIGLPDAAREAHRRRARTSRGRSVGGLKLHLDAFIPRRFLGEHSHFGGEIGAYQAFVEDLKKVRAMAAEKKGEATGHDGSGNADARILGKRASVYPRRGLVAIT